MILKLFHSGKHKPLDIPANKGSNELTNLLWLLKNKGISSEIIDTDTLSEEDIHKAYSEAVTSSVYRKFGIRRVFGTRRRSGHLFGREVPALFVYKEDGQYPDEVYPHEGGRGMIKTAREYLYNLQTSLMIKSVTGPTSHQSK